ncbi:winged helix-turn-helix transcriptional regulator [Actinocorallia longicatena]|uniref:Winged helix-turn-helix transcriptional regulator n=1 Tax=Actinocorallia longicatena TaxID=111803 RepID=A0ABP6QK13_9ACTN
MAGKRSYQDPCGIARALDLVGERWALLVVRELLYGARRFSDLHRTLPSLSQNVLSTRLRELEEAGVVHRPYYGPPVGVHLYELTERGRGLEDVLVALARWGSLAPLPGEGELSAAALVLALRTTFRAADAPDADILLDLGEGRFHVRIRAGECTVAAAAPETRADAVLRTSPAVLRDLVFAAGDVPGASGLGIEGDAGLATRFLGWFPRPG